MNPDNELDYSIISHFIHISTWFFCALKNASSNPEMQQREKKYKFFHITCKKILRDPN